MASLNAAYQLATAREDGRSTIKALALLNTADGYYDFEGPNLNHEFPDYAPINFSAWFRARWGP